MARLAILCLACLLGGCAMESRYFLQENSDFPTPQGVRDVYFRTPDGRRLHGWFVPARSLASGAASKAPCVLLCHGQQRTINYYAPRLTPITDEADVSLFVFSYRGYGRSDPESALTRRETLIDANAALDAALALPEVDPARVGVIGYSLGGPAALGLATSRPEIRFVAVGGTFSTARAILRDQNLDRAHILIGPDLDPAASARRLSKKPLMVFHAGDDSVIPVYHALEIASAAMQAGSPTVLHIEPGVDHMDLLERPTGLKDAMVKFIRWQAYEQPLGDGSIIGWN